MLAWPVVLSLALAMARALDLGEGYLVDRLTLRKPYGSIHRWQTMGSVLNMANKIRLTPEDGGAEGSIWSSTALDMNAFSVEVRFRITSRTHLIADGLGIWFAKEASVGSSYGVNPNITGFGIVLDTYRNGNDYSQSSYPHAYLLASNGTMAIDMENNGLHHRLANCAAAIGMVSDVNSLKDDTAAFFIEYGPGKMKVYKQQSGSTEWELCFERTGIFIPRHFRLGVSASTGDLTSQHLLTSIVVREVPWENGADQFIVREMSFDEKKDEQEEQSAEGGSFISLKAFFFIVAMLVVFGAMAVFVFPNMMGTSARNQKRFY